MKTDRDNGRAEYEIQGIGCNKVCLDEEAMCRTEVFMGVVKDMVAGVSKTSYRCLAESQRVVSSGLKETEQYKDSVNGMTVHNT